MGIDPRTTRLEGDIISHYATGIRDYRIRTYVATGTDETFCYSYVISS